MNDQNFKKFLFLLNFENGRKNKMKSASFLFILYKEKMLTDKAKIES